MQNPSVKKNRIKIDSSFLKIGQAAQALGVSIDTLRRWEKAGKISTVRTPGGTRLYHISALKEINPAAQTYQIETHQSGSLSTEELLKKADLASQGPTLQTSSPVIPANAGIQLTTSDSELDPRLRGDDNFKKTLFAKFLIGTAFFSAVTLLLASWITASYLTQPKATRQFFQNNVASGLFSPFHTLAQEIVAIIDPRKARELGFAPPEEPPPSVIPDLIGNLYRSRVKPGMTNGNVLAVTASSRFLELNTDTQINGSLFVRDSINGLSLEATPSAGIFALTSGDTTLTVIKDALLDQDVSTTASPTFNTLNLSATSNQLVFQSGGPTGTLTWTPTATRTITLPDITTTLVGIDNTQTLTNKSMSGASNTFTNIPNSALTNSKVTVTAGTNLTGGGDINLGSSATISLKDSVSLSGTLGVTGATTLSSTLAVTGATTLSSSLAVSGNVGIGYTGSSSVAFPSLGLAVAGNVGISTTSPQGQLDVNGTSLLRGAVTASSSVSLTALSSGTGNAICLNSSNQLVTCTVGSGGISGSGTSGYIPVFDSTSSIANSSTIWNSGGNVGIGATTPNSTLVVVGNALIGNSWTGLSAPTSGLLIEGNVGIGATTSSNKLDVWGNARIAGTATIDSTLTVGGVTTLSANNAALSFTGSTPSLTSGGNVFGLFAGGNVGIGTTDNLYGGLTVRGAGTGTNIALQTYGSNLTQGLSVLDNGNVGIGRTAPAAKLDVNGASILRGNLTFGTDNSYDIGATGATRPRTGFFATSLQSGLALDGDVTTFFGTPRGYFASAPASNAQVVVVGVAEAGLEGYGANIIGLKTRSTSTNANTVVQSGDELMSIHAWGADGASYRRAGGIYFYVDGTPGSSDMPGRISFHTTPDGSASQARRMVIDNGGNIYLANVNSSVADATMFVGNSGNVGIGTTGYGARLSVFGGVGIGNTGSGGFALSAIPDLGLAVQGNVGIGTTTANSNLTVVGNAMISNSWSGLTVPTSGLFVEGNVGIGATTSNNKLDVWGATNITGNVGVGSSLTVGSTGVFSGGLVVNGGSVVLPSGSIQNSELENSSITVSATAGTGISVSGSPVSLGGTLTVAGIDASTSVKGVASFNSTNFSVSSGAVNTIQDIATTSSPSFVGLSLTSGNLGIGTSSTGAKLQVNGGGIFWPSTTALTGPTNGLAVFGNVGVGTTSPAANLEVIPSSNSYLRLFSTTDAPAFQMLGNGDGANYAWFELGRKDSNQDRWQMSMAADGSNRLRFIALPTNSENLSLLPGGNVGIGATLPNAKLSIQGNVGIGYTGVNQVIPVNGLAVFGNVGIGTTTANSNLSISGNAHIGSLYQGTAAPTDGLFVDGNVGIGATTSNNKLDVWGNARIAGTLTVDSTITPTGQFLAIDGSKSAPSYSFASSGNSDNGMYLPSANALSFSTAGNDVLTLTAGGNVGIGTTSPSQKLEINGNALLNATRPELQLLTSGTGKGRVAQYAEGAAYLTANLYYDGTNWNRDNTSIAGSVVDISDVIPFRLRYVASGANPATLTESIRINTSGNIGIGLTTANSQLSISNNVHIGSLYQGTVAPTNGLFVDGNVGIGATSTAYNLDVWGTGRFSSGLTVGGNVGIGQSLTVASGAVFSGGLVVNGGSVVLPSGSIGNSELENSSITVNATAGTGISVSGSPVSLGGTLTVAGIDASTSVKGVASFNSTNFSVSSGAVNTIQDIATTSSPTFVGLSLSSGNLGIGTSATGAKLQVNGGGIFWPSTASLTGPTNGLAVFGNVGIGTTSPNNKLQVIGAGVFGADYGQYSASANGLLIQGNVGIGATTSSNKLDVWGNARIAGTLTVDSTLTNSSVFRAANGSATAPSYSFTDSTSTGLWSPSANALSLTTNGSGTSGITIAANGNVGIGVTAPAALLHISNTSDALSTIRLSRSGSSNDWGVYRYGSSGSDRFCVGIYTVNEPFCISTDGNVGIGLTTANSQLSISNNVHIGSLYQGTVAPTNGLFVDGNVGIGATTSNNKLDVWGNARIAGTLTIDSTSTFGGNLTLSNGQFLAPDGTSSLPSYSFTNSTSTGMYSPSANALSLVTNGASTPALTITAGGNVGIGTTAPISLLSVNGTGQLIQGITNSTSTNFAADEGVLSLINTNTTANNYVRLGFKDSTAASANYLASIYGVFTDHTNDYGDLAFSTRSASGLTEKIRILSTGNIGIGTTQPQAKLSIQGNVGIGYTGANQAIPNNGLAVFGNVGIGTTTANSNLSISGNAHIGSLYQGISAPTNGLFVDGNVGIGATTSNNKLDVWGNARLAGTTTIDSTLTVGGVTTLSANNAALSFTGSTPSLTSGGNVFGLFAGGNVGIGTTDNLYGGLTVRGAGTGTNIALQTYGSNLTQGLSVLDNGNVGIGTTSPTQSLSVSGNAIIGSSTATSETLSNASFVMGGDDLFVAGMLGVEGAIYNDGGVTSAGNLTGSDLVVTGGDFYSSTGDVRLSGEDSINIIMDYNNDDANTRSIIFGKNTTGVVPAGSDELMRITEAGNVGIGTSGPGSLFAVSGNATIGFGAATSIAGPTSGLGISGNLGIGTTTVNSNLSVVGNAHIGGLFQGISAPADGLFVDGNVGIGATSTAYNLDVWGTGRLTSALTVGGNVGIGSSLTVSSGLSLPNSSITNANLINSSITVSATAGTGISVSGSPVSLGGTLTVAGIDASTSVKGVASFNSTNFSVSSGAVNTIQDIATTSSPTFVGLSLTSGNLGIGTSTTGAKLQVNGGGIFWPNTTSLTGPTNGLAVFGNVGIGTTTPLAPLHTWGNGTNSALFLNGNVGIGFTTPDRLTQLASDINITGSLASLLGAAGTQFGITGNSGSGGTEKKLVLGIDTTDNYGVIQAGNTSGTNYTLSLNPAGGNVGIGTTSPGAPLHIVGAQAQLRLDGSAAAQNAAIDFYPYTPAGVGYRGQLLVTHGTDADAGKLQLQLANTSGTLTTRLYIEEGGNLGIGTDTTPDYRLELYDDTNTPDFGLSDDDVAHGVTTIANTDTFSLLSSISTTVGGAQITGLADATGVALGLKGIQSSDPTDSTPAISLIGAKASGTGVQDLADAETILQIANNDNAAALTILGNGNIGIGATIPNATLSIQGNVGIGYTGVSQVIPSNGLAVFGNVGIGTTSPNSKLSVIGGGVFTNTWGGAVAPTAGLIVEGNTGIGVSAPVQQFQVNPNGSSGFVVTSGGNVGIGTTSPVNKLQLNNGQLKLSIDAGRGDTDGRIIIDGRGSNPVNPALFLYANTSANAPSINFYDDTGSTVYGRIMLDRSTSPVYTGTAQNDFVLGTESGTNRLHLGTNSIARLTVDSAGNVGIGTTTANSLLSVAGGAHIGALYQSIAAPANGLFVDGNVGIGATTSSNKLDVWGNARIAGTLTLDSSLTLAGGQFLAPNGTAALPSFAFSGDTDSGLWNVGTNLIALTTNGAGALQTGTTINGLSVNANGNVGIGTTNPTAALDVAGATSTISNTTGNLTITPASNLLISAGNVGIGFTSPAQKLDVAGRIVMQTWTADGDTAVFKNSSTGALGITSSDARLKKNLEPIQNALSIISQITGYKYNGLDEADGSKKRLGVMAQDLLPILPEATFAFTNGAEQYYSVHYEKLTALLIEGVKEQQTQINGLIAGQNANSTLLSGLSVNSDGTLTAPEIKTGKLVLSSEINLTAPALASLLATNASTSLGAGYQLPTTNEVDVLASLNSISTAVLGIQAQESTTSAQLANLESRVDSQESKVQSLEEKIASLSAQIATTSTEIASAASSSLTTNYELPTTNSLDLTPPDILLATQSAQLVNLEVTSDATVSGQLTAYDLNIQNSLKSLGQTTLGATLVAGDFTIDGTLSLTGSSLSTLGNLKLQNGPLAGPVDFFNGLVTIDKTGKLIAQEIITPSVVTNKLTISNIPIASSSASLQPTIGSGKLLAGQTKIPILTNQITPTSKVFITPKSSTQGQMPYVELNEPDIGFVVSIDSSVSRDIDFDWWIVETR